METSSTGSPPTPEEARRALASARAEEDATANRPVPAWYFPVLAGILFALFALNAIDDPSGLVRILIGVTALVLAVAAGGLVGRISFHQPGYRGIRVKWRSTISAVLIALVFPIAAIALDGILGSWVYLVAGAALAALLLTVGTAYQRKHRHA